MLKQITLLGSSSGRNAGDAALIGAIMARVDRRLGRKLEYEIPTIRPEYICRHYPNHTRPVGMMPWHGSVKMLGLPTYRSVMRTDLTLIFDAILFDRALYNPLFNFMSSLYLMLPHAQRSGRRIAAYNVGAGPIRTAAGRRMLRTLGNLMEFITVRDRESLEILQEAGVDNPRIFLGADAALQAPSPPEATVSDLLKAYQIDPGSELLGININQYLDTWAAKSGPSMGKQRFLEVYRQALATVSAKLNVPLVFITTQHADIPITRELMSLLPPGCERYLITNREFDHYQIKGILRRMSLLCGMRLHSMILASAELAPIVGLNYQPKVKYYFNSLGLGDRTLSFDRFEAGTLTELILDGWADRVRIRQTLEQKIPELQKRAQVAAEVVGGIADGLTPAAAFDAATAAVT